MIVLSLAIVSIATHPIDRNASEACRRVTLQETHARVDAVIDGYLKDPLSFSPLSYVVESMDNACGRNDIAFRRRIAPEIARLLHVPPAISLAVDMLAEMGSDATVVKQQVHDAYEAYRVSNEQIFRGEPIAIGPRLDLERRLKCLDDRLHDRMNEIDDCSDLPIGMPGSIN